MQKGLAQETLSLVVGASMRASLPAIRIPFILNRRLA